MDEIPIGETKLHFAVKLGDAYVNTINDRIKEFKNVRMTLNESLGLLKIYYKEEKPIYVYSTNFEYAKPKEDEPKVSLPPVKSSGRSAKKKNP